MFCRCKGHQKCHCIMHEEFNQEAHGTSDKIVSNMSKNTRAERTVLLGIRLVKLSIRELHRMLAILSSHVPCSRIGCTKAKWTSLY